MFPTAPYSSIVSAMIFSISALRTSFNLSRSAVAAETLADTGGSGFDGGIDTCLTSTGGVVPIGKCGTGGLIGCETIGLTGSLILSTTFNLHIS